MCFNHGILIKGGEFARDYPDSQKDRPNIEVSEML